MNTKFLSLAVIFAVLIIPIMSGFMMPSDTTTEIDYEIGAYTDVTKSMENSTTEGSAYNATYINNQYTLDNYGNYSTRSNATTVRMNNYPSLSVDDADQISINPSTQQTWDLTSRYSSSPRQMIELKPGNGVTDITDSENNYVNVVYYYPGTHLCYSHMGGLLVEIDPTEIHIIATSANNYGAVIVSYYDQDVDASGKPLYLDPSSGFVAGWGAGYGTKWTNSRENTIIAMVVDPTEQPFLRIGLYDAVRLVVDANGDITVRITYNQGDAVFEEFLGNAAAYPYALIIIDTIEDEIMVSGLVNMQSFTDFPTNHIGNTVTNDVEDLSPIKELSWDRLAGTSPTYSFYVPYTYALTEGMACIEDNTLSVGSYYPNKVYYAFMMASTTLYGDQLTLSLSTTGDLNYTFDVEDGMMKNVPTERGNVDIPLASMTVYLVPVSDTAYTVKINDYVLDEIEKENIYAKLNVTFHGEWKTTTLITTSTASTKEVYVWGGGFNIDFTTFCGIGMLVAFCFAIIAGMYYRTTETGLLPMFLAILCGIVYIVLLMGVFE